MLTVTRKSLICPESKTIEVAPGLSLKELIPSSFHGFVELNGRQVDRKSFPSTFTRVGDRLELCMVPGVGGGLIFFILSAAVVVTSAVLAAENARKLRRLARGGAPTEEETTPDPFFRGLQTQVGPGHPISLIFGKPRVAGIVIESFNDVKFDVLPDSVVGEATTQPELTSQGPASRTLNTRIAWGHGPVQAITDLEIDDNPIENILGIQFRSMLGTRDQGIPTGFGSEIKNEVSVDSLVSVSGGAITKTTITAVDTVQVGLLFTSGLNRLDDKGKLQVQEVTLKIEYREAGVGGFVLFKQFTAGAQTRSPHPFWIRLLNLPRLKYDIKVTRVTADSTDPQVQDLVTWDKLTEVRFGSRAHPGIANTGFRHLPQEQTSAPRKYTALVQGLNKIRVYTDTTTFAEQWSDNPLWCFLYWVTHKIHGLGRFYDFATGVDIAAFLDAAIDHCDGTVSNGAGGTEKRCIFDFELNTKLPAQDIIRIFEQASDCSIVERGGQWTVIPHRSSLRVMKFNETDYELNSLTWQFVPDSERPTRMIGSFLDGSRGFKPNSVTVEDPNLPATDHFEIESLSFPGVSRGTQVARSMSIMMNFERLATARVRFKSGIKGLDLVPGQVFGLASKTGGSIVNGRILEIVAPAFVKVRIDQEITLDSGKTYEIVVQHQDSESAPSITTLALVSPTDIPLEVVEVASANWTSFPQTGDSYSIGEVGSAVQDFRCESVQLDDSYNSQIVAALYDPAMFSPTFFFEIPSEEQVEFGGLNKVPDIITELRLAARLPQDSGGQTRSVIDVTWCACQSAALIASYEIWSKVSSQSSWVFQGRPSNPHWIITENIAAGTVYDVAVRAVSPTLRTLPLDLSAQATIQAI